MARTPYTGRRRKLILAFDIGTTYSGVSYCVLDPGLDPEVKSVTRFPCQSRSGGDAKIPTIIYYDKHGVVRAAGAQALEFEENLHEMDETEKFYKAEWFKLHLRPPQTRTARDDGYEIPALPPRKTIEDVFADFMNYLFDCARTFLIESAPNGQAFWTSFGDNIEYVLTHPNGWGGAQQAQMRASAVQAGLIPADTPDRVQFCTEGEASLHFCLQNGLTLRDLNPTDAVLILDCGGGTIDISTYAQSNVGSSKVSVHEIAEPQCSFNGSIYVSRRARDFLKVKLDGSNFQDDLDHIVRTFDKATKLTFKNAAEPQFIRFGSMRDNNPGLGVRAGQLRMSGGDVASFFDPSITEILRVVNAQQQACLRAGHRLKTIFLVGGFAASDYLFSRLQDDLEMLRIKFCRPDTHVNKAVADGAVSYYIDHVVTERISKAVYGVSCTYSFDASDPEHMTRRDKVFVGADGRTSVEGGFSTILTKGVQVSETKEFKQSFTTTAASREALERISVTIESYRGTQPRPEWKDAQFYYFFPLCRVKADTRAIARTLQRRPNHKGASYHYRLKYHVVLLFGMTELKAQIVWTENGVERRSPAEVVYD